MTNGHGIRTEGDVADDARNFWQANRCVSRLNGHTNTHRHTPAHTCHWVTVHWTSARRCANSFFLLSFISCFCFFFFGFVMAFVFWFAFDRIFRVGGMHRTANSICRKWIWCKNMYFLCDDFIVFFNSLICSLFTCWIAWRGRVNCSGADFFSFFFHFGLISFGRLSY